MTREEFDKLPDGICVDIYGTFTKLSQDDENDLLHAYLELSRAARECGGFPVKQIRIVKTNEGVFRIGGKITIIPLSKEELRKEALAKLTADEISALGININYLFGNEAREECRTLDSAQDESKSLRARIYGEDD